MTPSARIRRFAALAVVFASLSAASGIAQTRTDNIDLFLVLDKSLSMESKIGAVKTYVNQSIVDNMLIPGDYLVLIDFYGTANVLLSTAVGSDKSQIEKIVNSIEANGHYTDIGNALDKLQEVASQKDLPDHRKVFMLMTDGIQEAPPSSRYYAPNGHFNHALLENAKTIQEQGWKVEILGIGSDTAAETLAKSVSGGFAQVSDQPTAAEIAQKAGDIVGSIKVNRIALAPVGPDGKTTLTMTLATSGLTSAESVTVDAIRADVAGMPSTDISHGATIQVPANATPTIHLPVVFDGYPKGSYQVTLTFTFNGTSVFVPAVETTGLVVNGSIFSNPYYLGGGALLVILLVVLAIVLVRRSATSTPLNFTLTIETDIKQSYRFSLRAGREVFIQETPFGFRAVDRRITDPVARLFVSSEGLRLDILNKERMKAPALPKNVLGERLKILTKANKSVYFVFKKL